MNQDYINKNVTTIIRTVGERTTGLCTSLIRKQISKENIFIVNESPFTKAIRKSFEIGMKENRKWTFIVDADVLLFPNVILNLYNYAENFDDNIFEIEGKIIDKFLNSPREAGNHFYKTHLLEKAIQFIPDPLREIRPETFVKNQMRKAGYNLEVIEFIVGLHDFEQSYKDIYRKCFVQSKKHFDRVIKLKTQWELIAKNDLDFKLALKGFTDGSKLQKFVGIDDKSDYMHNFNNILSDLSIKNKDNEIVENMFLWDAIKDIGEMLRFKNQLILNLENEILRKDKRIKSREENIKLKEKVINNYNEKIESIVNSGSYKIGIFITKPLRVIKELFKR